VFFLIGGLVAGELSISVMYAYLFAGVFCLLFVLFRKIDYSRIALYLSVMFLAMGMMAGFYGSLEKDFSRLTCNIVEGTVTEKAYTQSGNAKYKLTDVMIELYSNLEAKKLGWAFQSEADYLFYYKGGQVCIIDAEDVKKIAKNIFDALSEFDFDGVELNKITKQSITIDKVEARGNILVSKPTGQTWTTVSYALPIETMKKLTTKIRVRNL
jgi:hypothetical protein